jgi:hypothetical protein
VRLKHSWPLTEFGYRKFTRLFRDTPSVRLFSLGASRRGKLPSERSLAHLSHFPFERNNPSRLMSINSRYSKRIRSHPRRAMKRTLFPAVMLFLLTSCVTVRERDDTSLRTWRTFHAGFDRMWGVLVSEISSFAVIKTIDKTNGLITTEPLRLGSGLMSEILLKLYAHRPSNVVGTWDDARAVLSFSATSKGSSTTVRITARFTGFESNVTHSWIEWPTKGVLENFLLDRIANYLEAPSASAARTSKLANNWLAENLVLVACESPLQVIRRPNQTW